MSNGCEKGYKASIKWTYLHAEDCVDLGHVSHLQEEHLQSPPPPEAHLVSQEQPEVCCVAAGTIVELYVKGCEHCVVVMGTRR
jgi:hypothetical protein